MDTLQLRVADLEQQILGDTESKYEVLNLGKAINDIQSRIKSLTIGNDRFALCNKELTRLQPYICSDDVELCYDRSTRLQDVLAFQDDIISDTILAQQIEHLKPCLDKPFIHDSTQHAPLLEECKLSLIQASKANQQISQQIASMSEQVSAWHNNVWNMLTNVNDKLVQLEARKNEASQ